METADYLKERLGGVPEMLIIAGSGLSGLGELAEDAVEVPYSEIPGFLRSTVKSHRGVLVGGRIRGKRVAIMCAYMLMHFLKAEPGHAFDFLLA